MFPTVIAQAQEAEAAGADAVFVMDHFYQLPNLGKPEEPMLEAYTALGALANATQRVQLGTLVTGNTYRNPTLLAKAITTLDVISQGRAILGIGTGWFELEHDSLGYEFGTFTDRFNKLDEALEIILPMLRGERVTVNGKYYQTNEAFAIPPRFRDHIPLMIGGSGEKKTIPLAAKHFDHLNVIAGFDELPRKVQVVNEQCEKIGRDPATLETSMLVFGLIDDNITEDFIPPDDVRQRAVWGIPPRPDRRPDQDQGARRRRRRRHPQSGHPPGRLPPGPNHRRRGGLTTAAGRVAPPRRGLHHLIGPGTGAKPVARATTVVSVLCMSLRSRNDPPPRCHSIG